MAIRRPDRPERLSWLFIGEVGRWLESPGAIVHARRPSEEEQGRPRESPSVKRRGTGTAMRITSVVEDNARGACWWDQRVRRMETASVPLAVSIWTR